MEEFGARLRAGQISEIVLTIRNCYQAQPNTSDKIAYCFALDYSAMRLDLASAARSSTTTNAYLEPEKVLTRANRAFQAIKVEQHQRGVLIAFWSKLTRSMLEKLPAAAPADTVRRQVIEQARVAILRLAREPRAARVTNMQFRTTPNMRGEPTEVVCGRMAERMVDGSYSAPRPFVFFVRDSTANYDNGPDDFDREIVKNFCVN
jgi:hypothetical protein